MNQQKKETLKQRFKEYMTPALIVTIGAAMLGGIWELQKVITTHEVEAKEVQFESSEQKHNVIGRYTEYPNDYDLYQLMMRNEALDKKLDTSFGFVNAIFKRDIAKQKLDSADKVHRIKSRAGRDSLVFKQAKDIGKMQREQRITSNAIQLILQKLDTTR